VSGDLKTCRRSLNMRGTVLCAFLLVSIPSLVTSQIRRGDPNAPELWEEEEGDPEIDGREVSQTRFWQAFTPSDRLPLPENWSWLQYKDNLLDKDSDTGSWLLPPGWVWSEYHTNDHVVQLLASLQSKCAPGLARTYEVGLSELGLPMQAIQIGAQPQGTGATSNLIPEVKLTANMHGDERAGKELLLRLAWELCRRYETADDLGITSLLKQTSVHILPTMNPDGSDRRTRGNARGKDLNRRFPLLGPTRSSENSQVDSLPAEVLNVMRWHAERDFVLSFNLHGGALVVSYPMDACDPAGKVTTCPSDDDPLPLHLARQFADSHGRMSSMPDASPSFNSGVTRGSEWYPILGSMQDWVWHATSCTELTIEIHESKEINDLYADRLPYLYMESRDSFLNFIRQVHMTVKGSVVDDSKGDLLPLDATVTVISSDGGTDLMGRTTHSRANRAGSFFRLLVPGRAYCMVVEAVGYYRHYAAVMIPASATASPSATLQHTFRMSKTASLTALLGEGRREQCTYVQASNSDNAVLTSVEHSPDTEGANEQVIEMSCKETELVHHPDGRVELKCINFCKGMEMEPVEGSSAFNTKCLNN